MKIDAGQDLKLICFGTGACVDASGIIITAKHVVTSYYEFKTGLATPERIETPLDFSVVFTRRARQKYELFHAPPQRIALLRDFDVAMMKIEELSGGWPAFAFPNSWTTREGDFVATAGFPLRDAADANAVPQLFTGIISHINSYYRNDIEAWMVKQLVMDMSVHPGNSGGPIFQTDSGELVGIIESQKLRAVDISNMIDSMSNRSDHDDGFSQGSVQVWTNISYGVPWTAIRPAVEGFAKEVKPS